MRVLVTGHRGFVGFHLCKRLVDDGHEVAGLDIKDGHDVGQRELPFDIDRVFHLAAQTKAQTEQAYQDAAVNILASIRVFSTYGDKVVFASSSMVNYPVTPYGISKRAAEDYARFYNAAIVRFCNLYGPGGHSVFDRFREEPRIKIYGTGEQLRTYAPVGDAVEALIAAKPGQTTILGGTDYTVNEIAEMFPGKPVDRGVTGRLDLADARQIG